MAMTILMMVEVMMIDDVDGDNDGDDIDLQSQERVLVLQDQHRPAYHPAQNKISPCTKNITLLKKSPCTKQHITLPRDEMSPKIC